MCFVTCKSAKASRAKTADSLTNTDYSKSRLHDCQIMNDELHSSPSTDLNTCHNNKNYRRPCLRTALAKIHQGAKGLSVLYQTQLSRSISGAHDGSNATLKQKCRPTVVPHNSSRASPLCKYQRKIPIERDEQDWSDDCNRAEDR